ncbi:MAG: ribonuclease PH [Chloroflexi bacterium]|nr:ribonuclease PH [Chloroflexota bacterium]
MVRRDGREPRAIRPVKIIPDYLQFADGSALIEMGSTRVLCAATVEERLPPFLQGRGQGWITAEYGMLPRATPTRSPREAALGRPGGRTQEIQRLIGRALRATADLSTLGERSVVVDCDVLQADGGTRTAAITGGYVALALALRRVFDRGQLSKWPLRTAVAAISAGIVRGNALLDLCYQEGSRAEVDINVAMTADGKLVEVQGTAEGEPFDRRTLDQLLDLAAEGIRQLLALQRQALGDR